MQRSGAAEQVVNYLREGVSSGRWREGDKLPSENQLVEALGVSRPSVRSALQYLAGLGALRSQQGKGSFLLDADPDGWDNPQGRITSEDCRDICKVLEFRRLLEPGLCRIAVERVGSRLAPELERWLGTMRRCYAQGDSSRFVRADLGFHEVICHAAENPLASKSLHGVFVKNRHNHEQMNALFGYEAGIRDHTAIVEAFRSADAARAEALMEAHICEALKRVQALIPQDGGSELLQADKESAPY